eukprot:scaffold263247_cov27-Tisochrysis_lutea.AAC.3
MGCIRLMQAALRHRRVAGSAMQKHTFFSSNRFVASKAVSASSLARRSISKAVALRVGSSAAHRRQVPCSSSRSRAPRVRAPRAPASLSHTSSSLVAAACALRAAKFGVRLARTSRLCASAVAVSPEAARNASSPMRELAISAACRVSREITAWRRSAIHTLLSCERSISRSRRRNAVLRRKAWLPTGRSPHSSSSCEWRRRRSSPLARPAQLRGDDSETAERPLRQLKGEVSKGSRDETSLRLVLRRVDASDGLRMTSGAGSGTLSGTPDGRLLSLRPLGLSSRVEHQPSPSETALVCLGG